MDGISTVLRSTISGMAKAQAKKITSANMLPSTVIDRPK